MISGSRSSHQINATLNALTTVLLVCGYDTIPDAQAEPAPALHDRGVRHILVFWCVI